VESATDVGYNRGTVGNPQRIFGMWMTENRAIGFVLMGLVLLGGLAVEARAQSIPNSAQPGAILQWEQRYFNLQRTSPFLFGVMREEDLVGRPKDAEPVIIFEDGVIPGQRKVQGTLTTPEGSTYISPDGP